MITQKQKSGFSLVEILVVLAVLGIMLPAFFSLVFSVLRQQVKLQYMSRVKREGDAAFALMREVARDRSVRLTDAPSGAGICETAGTSANTVYFYDETGNWITFILQNNQIVAQRNTGSETLTSSNVTVSGLTVSCVRKARYAAPLVSMSFTVSSENVGRSEAKASLPYRTSVVMRSYVP